MRFPSQISLLCLLSSLIACQCQPRSPLDTMSVEPSSVDFGRIAVGSKKEINLNIRQEAATPTNVLLMNIDSQFGNSQVFSVVYLRPAVISRGEATIATLGFSSAEPGAFSGRALIYIEGSSTPFSILLTGEAFSNGPSKSPPDSGSGAADASFASDAGANSDAGTDAGISDGGFSCQPVTCQQLGMNCGSIADGCGRTLACGSCVAPETCGGGGVSNVCGKESSSCGSACSNWTDCTNPGEGCDVYRGCCVPCGGADQPCCVDRVQGKFLCGGSNVCGRSGGSGTSAGYFCCKNQGDGCCSQGGCSGSTCCKCPRNGLNFCVQPSFGCGGC